MSSSSNGLVVKDAAVASPIAQDHQAIGCRSRGSALDDVADPVTTRQTPRLRRATTALPAIAIASRPTMLQVTAAGIRAGSSADGWPAVGVESAGDSTSDSVVSASSLARESPGDSSSSVPSSDFFFEPSLDGESPGDSEASGDSDGVAGDLDGDACGDDEPDDPDPPLPDEPPPALPPPDPGDGLDDCEPPPLDGVAVGDELGEAEGDDDGDDDGEDVGVAVGEFS